MWTSWSATIPFLLGMFTLIATIFWGVFGLWTTVILVVVFWGIGLTLTYLGSPHIAVLPLVYNHINSPDRDFVVVRYKTYWGISRGMNYVWQEAVKVLPGIYRLRGKTFEATTAEMLRSPDMFHDDDEFDESEIENDG